MSIEAVTFDCSGDEPVRQDQCCTTSSGGKGYTLTFEKEQCYLLYVQTKKPVAHLEGTLGSDRTKIYIQIDKNLNFRQRLVCWLLGLKYKKYDVI